MAAAVASVAPETPAVAAAPAAVVQTSPGVVNAADPTQAFANSSLYVGDLESNVDEGQLIEMFSRMGQVLSVRVCRDLRGQFSLGYGYVNFNTAQEAAHALEALNFTPVNGKPIRIMFSHRDPSIRKSGYANVYIKNLDKAIDNKALYDVFVPFGTVLSCKVAVDSSGQSKGYGFAQYDSDESARQAIQSLNGMLVNDRQVYVGSFIRRQERNQGYVTPKFTNVYVKNFPEATTDEEFKKLFEPCGTITSAVVMKDASGKSRCFGFVNFQSTDSAAAAVEKLNGTTLGEDKVLYVGRAQKKSERESQLRAKFEQERQSRYEKLRGCNLYMKNLEDDVNDEKLKELFAEFGTITSSKVMLDSQGLSKGCGFVSFTKPEEATKAIAEMNGKMIGHKPLYVALAQRKEERKSQLQHRFAQFGVPGGMHHLPAGIPGYPGGPRLTPQQLYYGQGAHMMPHQPAGYGFQQPMIPNMRPGIGPNFMAPYPIQRQGQHMQRMGPRRGSNNQHGYPQPPMRRNFNQGFRYGGNAQSSMDSPVLAPGFISSPVMPVPFDASGMSAQRPAPLALSALASQLTSATPEDQRLMLGEQLYHLVERLEQQHAAKVTGMLLEMDQTEVLHLLESPDSLKMKVAEAMDVLRVAASSASDVTDQVGSVPPSE